MRDQMLLVAAGPTPGASIRFRDRQVDMLRSRAMASRPSDVSQTPPGVKGIPRWLFLAAPALLCFILAAPCLRFSFVSDDFNFLQRAQTFSAKQLVPVPSSAFYRPISRELYFAFLSLLSRTNPLWGHLINAFLLAGAVGLMTLFVRRIGGEKLGLLSGLLLASVGALPCLVAWISCSQDIFAMVFIAAALNLELNRRRALAIACLVGALLSKESALFALPALLSLRYLATGKRRELGAAALPYLGAVAIWGAFHHRIRAFLVHGPATGEGGYVGIDNPFMLRNFIRTAGTLVNIPPTVWNTPWVPELTLCLVLALVLVWALYRYAPQGDEKGMSGLLSDRGVLVIGALFGILPAILTVISAKHWFPYYSCIPAMGTSILLALPLRKMRWRPALIAAAVFLTLGVWYRGTNAGMITLPAEANFRAMSNRLQAIDAGIRKLHPQFPDSARIYLSVQDSVETGVHVHLMHAQAMRTWYKNNTLLTMPAEYQDNTQWPKYLFGITSRCHVFEIDLSDLHVRSLGALPSTLAYQKALRSYAMGAWAAGDTDRAIAVLRSMQEPDAISWDFDRRLTAALLLASGRVDESRVVLRGFPRPGRAQALDGVCAILTPVLPRPGLDAPALLVFGLRADDAEAFRYLMFYFSDRSLLEKTKRMAERLLELRPGDDEALAMLDALNKVPQWEAVLVGPEGWEPLFTRIY